MSPNVSASYDCGEGAEAVYFRLYRPADRQNHIVYAVLNDVPPTAAILLFQGCYGKHKNARNHIPKYNINHKIKVIVFGNFRATSNERVDIRPHCIFFRKGQRISPFMQTPTGVTQCNSIRITKKYKEEYKQCNK